MKTSDSVGRANRIRRRELGLLSAIAVASSALGAAFAGPSKTEAKPVKAAPAGVSGVTDAIVTRDGVTIYFKDWGPRSDPS